MSPAAIEIVDGATWSAKSAGAAAPIVKDDMPLCVKVPDVPLTAIELVPADAEAEELRLIWPKVPATNESVDGVAVMPEGSVPSETETVPVKPLTGVTPIDTD